LHKGAAPSRRQFQGSDRHRRRSRHRARRLGGGLGQGRAAASALDGIARNPQASGKIFVPMIVALALIESLVIYGLLIAFNLAGKL
jgi:F0F1-type ATP synthase membrane subunit c/vacuolar-type H+-ATPase subunit K